MISVTDNFYKRQLYQISINSDDIIMKYNHFFNTNSIVTMSEDDFTIKGNSIKFSSIQMI
jgi:hypothetical protein